jgi:micrococcal nuclease
VLIVLAQTFGWFDGTTQPPAPQPAQNGEVVRFVDGDTFSVNLAGKQETIRLIGVDTPETVAPDTPVQCYGPAASAYIKNLVENKLVRLESDPSNEDRDRYGRLLRYAYLPDGRLVQQEIIRNGYGFAYTVYPFTQKDAFVTAENSAREAGKGLWDNCTVTETDGRKQTNPAE